MDRKLNLVLVQNTLNDCGFNVFTPFEFARIMGVSLTASQQFLEKYTKREIFQRIKKGLYVFNGNRPPVEELANRVYSPSYISLHTALSHYNLIPETVYSITSATTKPTRRFYYGETALAYYRIKQEAFTGYAPIEYRGYTGEHVLMAVKEKALVDYLYFVNIGELGLNDRLDTTDINFDVAQNFAKLFKRPRLERMIYDLSRRT